MKLPLRSVDTYVVANAAAAFSVRGVSVIIYETEHVGKNTCVVVALTFNVTGLWLPTLPTLLDRPSASSLTVATME